MGKNKKKDKKEKVPEENKASDTTATI